MRKIVKESGREENEVDGGSEVMKRRVLIVGSGEIKGLRDGG